MDMSFLVTSIIEWKKKYGNVFICKIDGNVFVFRALTRKEFKETMNNEKLTDQEKEEEFCRIATLYPEDFDFENCNAGIPTSLADAILDHSLFKLNGRAKTILNNFRDEMKEYENQITCIITEAFPTLTLDEVESWPLEKILYYLSRAEFVLNKFRNLPFVTQSGEVYDDIDSYMASNNMHEFYNMQNTQSNTEKTYAKQNTNINNSKKPVLNELEELKRKFPEIDWENDSILTGEFKFDKDPTVSIE